MRIGSSIDDYLDQRAKRVSLGKFKSELWIYPSPSQPSGVWIFGRAVVPAQVKVLFYPLDLCLFVVFACIWKCGTEHGG